MKGETISKGVMHKTIMLMIGPNTIDPIGKFE
jgi:hypothetical protein